MHRFHNRFIMPIAALVCTLVLSSGCTGSLSVELATPTPQVATVTQSATAREVPSAQPTTATAPPPTPTTPPAASDAPGFWTRAGTLPDTMVAVLIRPDLSRRHLGDVAVMHADGTDLTQLTTYNYNADPVMAPDGRRIAYRSVPGGIVNSPDVDSRIYEGKYNIWVISVDGAQAWQLTDSEVVRGLPTWSPDSQRVAFSEGEGENSILVEIEVDSRARREMVTGASMPRYRPGGNGIGYVTPQGGLAWIDRDSAVHSIVAAETLPAETSVHDFDWMPDGEHVVYTLADETERMRPTTLGIRYSVWVARADGSDARQLAEALHDVQVSPDGQVIAAVKGSGFGDACIVDRQLAFLLPAPDLRSARTLGVTTFDGYPAIDQDHSFYLSGSVSWVSDRLVLARFLLTCAADYGIAGRYVVDPVGGEMMQVTGMEFLSGYE